MTLNEQQYERIARWLDGEALQLTAEEMSAALEVRAGEAGLAGMLADVIVPPGAMARANRRLVAATAGAWRRVAVRWCVGAASVAAAAIIAVTVLLHNNPTPIRPDRPLVAAAVPYDVWVGSMEPSAAGTELTVVGDELDRLQAELETPRSAMPVDRQIDSIQQDIYNFWVDDSPQADESDV
jgi:hypothetical protein